MVVDKETTVPTGNLMEASERYNLGSYNLPNIWQHKTENC